MAQHHEPWALAVTALVTVLVKVAREANCDLGKLSSSIRNDISALKPPFANSSCANRSGESSREDRRHKCLFVVELIRAAQSQAAPAVAMCAATKRPWKL